MNKTIIIAACAAALGIGALYGCSKAEEPAPKPASTDTMQPTTGIPAGYKNERGVLVCAVSGETLASEKDASSFEDYKGTRYYFCCGMCPPEFKKDPEKYADGKAIKAGTTIKM